LEPASVVAGITPMTATVLKMQPRAAMVQEKVDAVFSVVAVMVVPLVTHYDLPRAAHC